jgi:hypothetical protein
MGSKFLSKAEAAKILGRDERSVYRYLQKGLLSAAHQGKTIGVWEEEVVRLKGALVEHKNPKDLAISLLRADIAVLKSQVSTLMRMMDVRREPLNLTDPEIQALYKMTEVYSMTGWSPQVEDSYADTFVRMQDNDLEQLERLTGDAHPWRCFLLLASTMHLSPHDKNLRMQFEYGKTHLSMLAGVWCLRRGDTPKTLDLLVQRDATPMKKVLKLIDKERGRSDTPGEA